MREYDPHKNSDIMYSLISTHLPSKQLQEVGLDLRVLELALGLSELWLGAQKKLFFKSLDDSFVGGHWADMLQFLLLRVFGHRLARHKR